MGIGLGVITGSALKTIALQQQDGQGIPERLLSFNWISLPSIIDFKLLNPKKKERQNLNLNLPFKEKEIITLSKRWKELASKEKDLEASGYLLLLDNKRFAQLAPNAILPAASAIKIPILVVALSMVDSGQLSWNELLELNQNAVGGGAGWMGYQPLGESFPIYEIATEMIRISDNTATNLLIQRIGGIQNLNERFKNLGLHSTEIKNLLPDLKGSNTTSTKDLTHTIAMVDSGDVLSPRTRDLFREVMNTSRTNRLLPGGLLKGLGVEKTDVDYNLIIKGYRVYNKTGDIGIAYADAGLIQMPDNTRAVAGFIVKGPFNDPRSAELIRKLAAAMVPSLKPKSSIETQR